MGGSGVDVVVRGGRLWERVSVGPTVRTEMGEVGTYWWKEATLEDLVRRELYAACSEEVVSYVVTAEVRPSASRQSVVEVRVGESERSTPLITADWLSLCALR